MAFTVLFTGVPESGKTSVAEYIFSRLKRDGSKLEFFDSDVIWEQFDNLLSSCHRDRKINLRSIGITAFYLNNYDVNCLIASTAPDRKMRKSLRGLIRNFVEVYCKCPVEVAESRDSKGLYRLARDGFIPDFTGIDGIYEEPESPDIIIYTDRYSISECGEIVIDRLYEKYSGEEIFNENKIPK
jgi:adenylylsulfate kinase